jgi:SNF2 family DNA or RNA helicase
MKIARNYQTTAIQQGAKTNLLLCDQMGLGKSLVAIEICKAIFDKYDAPALIICPKGIRDQWQQMILDQDPKANVWICDVSDPNPINTLNVVDYIIIHYEALVKEVDSLSKIAYSTIVCDEAHRIKNHGTRSKPVLRTRAVKQLKAFRKIALTGTPFDKNPAEYWSLLNWLAPKVFTSYYKFIDDYIDFDIDYFGYKKNYRIKDPATFARMLQPQQHQDLPFPTHFVMGRKKRDVLPELPPLITTHVPITLSVQQQTAYEKIRKVKDIDVTINDTELSIKTALEKLVRLHQIASDPITLGLDITSTKLQWLLEWLEDNPTTPVLIFSRYRKAAEHVAQLTLADTLVLGGSKLSRPLSGAQRIVATIAAMSEGYDLGHIDTTIYIDADWSSIRMAQSMERIDRGSNTTSKQIIFLEAQHTVDSLVRTALENKWDQQQLIERYLREVQHATPV